VSELDPKNIDSKRLSEMLTDLAQSQEELNSLARGQKAFLTPSDKWEAYRKKLLELVQKAQNIAEAFEPDSFGISAGFPFGVNINLSWNIKE
jgi:hypothetical protein